jgi:hypothetical protein
MLGRIREKFGLIWLDFWKVSTWQLFCRLYVVFGMGRQG